MRVKSGQGDHEMQGAAYGLKREDWKNLLRAVVAAGKSVESRTFPETFSPQDLPVAYGLGESSEASPQRISQTGLDSLVKSLFRTLYRDAALPTRATLSHRLRTVIPEDAFLQDPLEIEHTSQCSEDGSVKLVFRVPGTALLLESVLMPERGRLTLCVSSQVGCAQGCHFCQTGKMGLLRQLSTSEIVAQVVLANRYWSQRPGVHGGQGNNPEGFGADRVTNLVFMGMGEPLDNLEAVLAACDILSDPWGLGIGISKITVSTVGLPQQMRKLLRESKVQVALSLHSPFDEQRSRMMPVNQRHPLSEVLSVLSAELRPGAHVFVQYTLIRNVNDSQEHALALANLLRGVPCKINVIPLNEHDGAAFRRPSLETVSQFSTTLKAQGFVVTLRLSKGRSIDAACGQLVKKLKATAPPEPLSI